MSKFARVLELVDAELSGEANCFGHFVTVVEKAADDVGLDWFSKVPAWVLGELKICFTVPWVESFDRENDIVTGYDQDGKFTLSKYKACQRLAKYVVDFQDSPHWPAMVRFAIDDLNFQGYDVEYMLRKPHKFFDVAIAYGLDDMSNVEVWNELFS